MYIVYGKGYFTMIKESIECSEHIYMFFIKHSLFPSTEGNALTSTSDAFYNLGCTLRDCNNSHLLCYKDTTRLLTGHLQYACRTLTGCWWATGQTRIPSLWQIKSVYIVSASRCLSSVLRISVKESGMHSACTANASHAESFRSPKLST